MSRSWKKHPYGGDNKSKFDKRYSNHVIRQKLKNLNFEIQHKDYKKCYQTWDICDYWSYCPWEEYWKNTFKKYYNWGNIYYNLPVEEKEYQKWLKNYHRK